MNPPDTQPLALAPDAGSPFSASPDTAIATLEGMLRVAMALVAAGRPIDLAGLDQRVGRVCAQALDLPPAEGRALRPRLAALLAGVEALAAQLAAAPRVA